MTVEFPDLAARNAPLLRAIAAGGAANATELATAGGLLATNIARQLNTLREAGLIVKVGAATHQVELTPTAQLALDAIAMFEGGGSVAGQVVRIDPDLIDDSPWQPRTSDPDDPAEVESDEQMALSIADKDVEQPITVRRVGDRYQQAFGHRRKRGAKLAKARGWLPADYGMPCLVRDLSDHAMEDSAIVENVQREDLPWMDEAEALLRLADRPMSAAEIQRLVGTRRKKRSIQDYVLIARKLSAEDKARTRLPEGDPQRLSTEQCKFLVGNRKAKAALDLPPRQACALLELLHAGEFMEGQVGAPGGLAVRLHAKPSSAGLVTLGDKGLVRFKVEGSTPIAIIELTEDLAQFATAAGFHDDPDACLAAARAEVVGELSAGALAEAHRYVTDELNKPEPVADSGTSPLIQPPANPAPEPEPAATLKPAHALALTELAHKVQREGRSGLYAFGRAVEVQPPSDGLAQELVYERLVTIVHTPDCIAMALTPTAEVWLDKQGVARDADGVAQVSDEALLYRQAELSTRVPAGGPYLTAWLNPAPAPAKVAAPQATIQAIHYPAATFTGAAPFQGVVGWRNTKTGRTKNAEGHPGEGWEPIHGEVPGLNLNDYLASREPSPPPTPPPAHGVRGDGVPKRDAFAQQILDLAAERRGEVDPEAQEPHEPTVAEVAAACGRMVQRLAAAAVVAQDLLAKARGRKLKTQELDQADALLSAALGDLATYTTKESHDAQA